LISEIDLVINGTALEICSHLFLDYEANMVHIVTLSADLHM